MSRRDLRNAEREWRNTDHRRHRPARFHVEPRPIWDVELAARPIFRRLWRWFWS